MEDFCTSGKQMKFLDGEVELLDYSIMDNAYPVIKTDSEQKIESLRNELDSMGIYHIGRNGNIEYLDTKNCLTKVDECLKEFISME
jgi:hypothetical protein